MPAFVDLDAGIRAILPAPRSRVYDGSLAGLKVPAGDVSAPTFGRHVRVSLEARATPHA